MTTVYFIRHAEPDYHNHDDALRPLTEKGMTDRLLVTAFLIDKNIDVVLPSPYIRAIDTIKDFADKQNINIKIVEDFRERKVDSIWIEDFDQFVEKQWKDFNYRFFDGECLKEVQDRNISAFKEVLKQYKGKSIVIGSHGTALSTIINYYDSSFGLQDFNDIKKRMPWIVKFSFDNQVCIKIEKVDLFAK